MVINLKAPKKHPKHDVWVTEIRLRFVSPIRQAKLQKLISLLKDKVVA